MSISGLQFAEKALSRNGLHYLKAGQGNIVTKFWLAAYRLKYGLEPYAGADAWIGQQVFDCSGLVTWTLKQLKLNTDSRSRNPEMYIHMCQRVAFAALQPGDLCFLLDSKGNAYHVGIYVGDGYTVQAANKKQGVIYVKDASRWNAFGRLPQFKEPAPAVNPVLDFGDCGAAVKRAQILLNKKGAKPKLDEDGDFGPLTRGEVIEFQHFWGLPVTGVVDAETWRELYK